MKKTRLTAILLSLLMITSSMISCSEEAAPSDKNNSVPPVTDVPDDTTNASESFEETVPAETELMDSVGEANYDGYNFRISSSPNGATTYGEYMVSEEMNGDPLNDALYESNQYLCDRFNIDVSFVEYSDITEQQTALRNSVNGGTDDFNTSLSHDLFTVTLMQEGFLARLDTIDKFDFTKPWWPENITDVFTINGRMYIASNYASYSGMAFVRALIYNKDQAKNNNIDISYDTVREGKWTLDEFHKLYEGTSRDLDGNGVIAENDFHGFVSGDTTYCWQTALGINIYPKDENGNLYFNSDLERITKFVDQMRVVMGNDYIEAGFGSMGSDIFELGNSLFVYTQIDDAYTMFRDNDFTYGFLPTPKLDELQENYINAGTDAFWCIPKTLTGDTLDITASIMEAMSCYNYKNVIPVYFEITMKSRIADSPDDAEMLQIIADTRSNCHAYTFQLLHRNLVADYIGSNKEPASVFKASEKAAQITLERFIKAVTGHEN